MPKKTVKERLASPACKFLFLGAIALIACIVLLPMSLLKSETIYSASGLTFPEKNIHVGEDTSVSITTDSFALTPGVYDITLTAELPAESTLICELKTRDESFKVLRTNEVNYPAHRSTVSFEAFVSDKLPDSYLQLHLTGADLDALREVTVVRSGRGYLRTLSILLLLLGFIAVLMKLRDNILTGRADTLSQVSFWVILVSILVAFYPYLSDYIIIRNATINNCLRIEGVTESISSSYTFPLWAGNLFYLIPANIRLLGFGLGSAFKYLHLIIIAAAALIAKHCLLLVTGSRKASLAGAVAYVFSPYFLNTLYREGAPDKAIAYALLPLVLAGICLLTGFADCTVKPSDSSEDTQTTRGKWYLVLGLTGLFQSHLASFGGAVVLTLVLLLAALIKTTVRNHAKTVCREALQGAVIFILLNAWSIAGYALNRGPLFGSLHLLLGSLFTVNTVLTMNLTVLVIFAAALLVRKTEKPYAALILSVAALFYGLYRTNNIAMEAFASRFYSAPAIGTPDFLYEGLTSATHPVMLLGLAVSLISLIAIFMLPILRRKEGRKNA